VPQFEPELLVAQFQTELVAILREYGGLSTEATWEHLAETIAAQFLKIEGQSPLSTFNMLVGAGKMVLLIRMASRKGGGVERAAELAEFQSLMAAVFAEEEQGRGGRAPAPVSFAREAIDDEDDEDEES